MTTIWFLRRDDDGSALAYKSTGKRMDFDTEEKARQVADRMALAREPVTVESEVLVPDTGAITARDLFAAAALQGLLACSTTCITDDKFVEDPWRLADAMMAKRGGNRE